MPEVMTAWAERLCSNGFASMLFASYFAEDNDPHCGNWGFNQAGDIVRIDFDQAAWPFTVKSSNLKRDPDLPSTSHIEGYRSITAIPSQQFPLTRRHIESLTMLPKGEEYEDRPFNWPGVIPHVDRKVYHHDMRFFIKNPDYQRDLYRQIVKTLLIPDEVIRGIARAHIPSRKRYQKADAYAERYIDRKQQVEREIFQSKQFLRYLNSMPQEDQDLIMRDLEQYNTVTCKSRTGALDNCKVRIDDVAQRLQALQAKAADEIADKVIGPQHLTQHDTAILHDSQDLPDDIAPEQLEQQLDEMLELIDDLLPEEPPLPLRESAQEDFSRSWYEIQFGEPEADPKKEFLELLRIDIDQMFAGKKIPKGVNQLRRKLCDESLTTENCFAQCRNIINQRLASRCASRAGATQTFYENQRDKITDIDAADERQLSPRRR